METKCIYVLVSTDKDCYYEQTLCSLYSLRLHNPKVRASVVVDKLTADTLQGTRSGLNKYIDELVKIDVPTEFNQMQRSRFLKTNLRQFVEGNYLFIDSDTVICDSLDEVDRFTFEIGAVADAHINIGNHRFRDRIHKWGEIGGWSVDDERPYLNSGIIYVKDTSKTREFYKTWYYHWYENYKKGLFKDQSSLARTNEEMGYVMHEMDGIWNCQMIENGLRFMSNAKILHYYGSHPKSPYLLNRKETFKQLKESGEFSAQLKEYIEHPLTAFSEDCTILSASDKELVRIGIRRAYLEKMPPIVLKFYHFIKHHLLNKR